MVRSRSEAAELVAAGRVKVDGEVRRKGARGVSTAEKIEIADGPRFVSRGGNKLGAALDSFGVSVEGLTCLDVGSSTGGFTDCLLQRGALAVVALDVGHDQLAPELRSDPRVRLLEGTDIRGLDPIAIGGPFSLVTVDVSFISLGVLAGSIAAMVATGGEALILVKPQFEVGRETIGRGVVRDTPEREAAIVRAVAVLEDAGLDSVDSMESPLTGEAGNRERFVWMHKP